MSEDDEEKTCFHTKERVYYFTHMPNGLKNSGATLQRTMEKVLAEHKEKNVEDGRGKVLMLCGNNKGNKSQSRKGKSHTLKHRCRRPETGKEPMLAAHKHRGEAEGKIVKKFFRQGEQVRQVLDKNDKETSGAKEKLQEELILTSRAWRQYIRRESNKEGSKVGYDVYAWRMDGRMIEG
ncbi:hypothetical protein Tco_0206744 [Tanacetum coccineum]